MIPRTRAPDARVSMAGDRILSNVETFETFATHYGTVLQKHKRKLRNHVISYPPRRSTRLLEKMLRQQQTPSLNGGKKVRRSYSAVSENDPEALIPVMSLSGLKTKRKYELASSEGYTPAPIEKRRSATFFECEDNPLDSADAQTMVKSEPGTESSPSLQEHTSPQSIIQIKEDFMKSLVRRRIPTDERSSILGTSNDGRAVDEADEEDTRSDDEDSNDRTASERRSDDGNEKSDERLSDNQSSDDRTTSESRSNALPIPSHEDSGMATTEYPQDTVCLDASEDDEGHSRNQDDISPCTRLAMKNFNSHEDDHFDVIHEEVCTITIQKKSNPMSAGHHDVSIKHSSVLCQDGRSDAAAGGVENASTCSFILNSPLPEVEETQEPAQEMNGDHVWEPVEMGIQEISHDGSTPVVIDHNEEHPSEIDSNQKYVYHPPFKTEDNSASGMPASDLDPQHQEDTETPWMPDHPPSRSQSSPAENSQIHGHESMFDQPPVYNCWLDANLQPLVEARNIFIRQGAFAIKYGGTTTIMTGVLHFNSEFESCLFEDHFLQLPPPMPNQFVQNQHYPPPHYQSDRTMPQTGFDVAAGAGAEVDDQEETQISGENRVNMKVQRGDDAVAVMEMESSDEEDNDCVRSSSHIRPSRPSPSAREIFLKLQPLTRHMRQRFRGFEKLKRYHLNHRHLRRIAFAGTVNFCKPMMETKARSMTIRLRSDLIAKETCHEERYERPLEKGNRFFIYEVHFRNNCTQAYVVHDSVDFLCLDCNFLRGYVRYMLGLSGVKEEATIEEIKTLDN